MSASLPARKLDTLRHLYVLQTCRSVKSRCVWSTYTHTAPNLQQSYKINLKYEGDSKSKSKIHLTAVIQVTVSYFTYYFST